MIAEDPSVYLADFGVLAEFNGEQAQVLFDLADEDVLHGVAQSRSYVITFASADLPTLGHGDAIIVDGKSYQVHTVNTLADGVFSTAHLFAP